MHSIKFGGMAKSASVLGAECAARWDIPKSAERGSYIITAIPLSKKRERERGFNQAECIARAVSEHSGIPYARLLERNKVTKAQAKLSAAERQENVADAFQISPQRNLELTGKTVILVDDVVTTGATLHEAAKTLRQTGDGHIICVTVAYAVLEKVRT